MSAPSGTPTSGGRSSPYGGLPPGGGDGGSSENVLNKIVTPLRWGIGGLTKTVRSRFHSPRGRRSKKKSREEDSSAHHASLPAQVRGFLGSPNAENEAGPSAAVPSTAPVAPEVRRTNDPARHSPRRAPPSLFNPKRRRSTSRLFRPKDAKSDALAFPLATRSAAQPASEVPRATQGAPSTANLLDALKQRSNLTREETQEVISLLQRHGQGVAAADAAGPSTAAMPPPAPVGLFQTPSSAGPSAARSPAGPASETGSK